VTATAAALPIGDAGRLSTARFRAACSGTPLEGSGTVMTKQQASVSDDDDGTNAPDLDVIRDVQLNRGEVLIWPSPNGRVFGFMPENRSN